MDNNTDYTAYGVVIVVDSTHKEAVLSVVNTYFGKEVTEEDLNEDGSYTTRLYINLTEEEIQEEQDD